MNHLVEHSTNRLELWVKFLHHVNAMKVAEVGVYKGDFAKRLLAQCGFISQYYLIDPWRNLDNWNKPANLKDDVFEAYFKQTLEATEFVKEKRITLRGKTNEVIHQIEDESLDFVYIDGDHTLKGISIDLINFWDKVKLDGFIGGDDFSPSIWQHSLRYEPTLVFPFAVYFAEAVGATIYALPFNQFLLQKSSDKGFRLINLSNESYKDHSLRNQIAERVPQKRPFLKGAFYRTLPLASSVYSKIYNLFSKGSRTSTS